MKNASRPTVYMMAGGPGAGKSYVRSQNERLSGLPVVDCDQFKQMHPDYNPERPQDLHQWSKTECKRAYYRALSIGESFVYDGTGTNVEKYVKRINDAHEAGFDVEIIYVACSLKTAMKRNAERPRTVPEPIVREKHTLISTAVEILSRYADRITTINND